MATKPPRPSLYLLFFFWVVSRSLRMWFMFDLFWVYELGLLVLCLMWGILHGLLEVLKHGCPRRAEEEI